MEATFIQKDLDRALGAAIRATSKTGSLPILAGILIEAVGDRATFSATNYDTSIQYKIEARTESSGKVLVSGKLLHDLVKKMPGPDVTLATVDSHLAVRSGAADYKIVTMNAAEFPVLEPVNADTTLHLAASDLQDIHRYTAFAVAEKDVARPFLTGILLRCQDGELMAAASDSHRLARKMIPFSTEASGSIIIPPGAMTEVVKLIDENEGVTLTWGKGKIGFQTDSLYLSCRSVVATYPDIERLVPKNLPTTLTLNRDELKIAIERLSIIASDRSQNIFSNTMRFAAADNILTISAKTGDKGQAREDLVAVIDGPTATIHLNGSQVLDGLNALGADKVVMSLPDNPLGAITIVGDGEEGFLYINCALRSAE